MKSYRVIIAALLALGAFASCKSGIEADVEKTLKGMDLDAKIGQMVQLNISLLEDKSREALAGGGELPR